MAQQEEPLYDFPEPAWLSQKTGIGHPRGGSLKSVSVLDRLLLTVPVWLQLSINPATALHILQREPPGAFLVRKSRTSQRDVLCVRLADDSVPSFVQQFGIREEHSTFCLETSAIGFPDLPRLIAFYCVSRDVLPFPLELPEAIAKATSHKELESISHMGIEFWSSQLNFRGPREPPKVQKNEKRPKPSAAHPPISTSVTSSANKLNSTAEPDQTNQLHMTGETDAATIQSNLIPTLFEEFCPIRTRSPRELNCGLRLGALCFLNPLFLQSQNALHRRRMFKGSIKVRVSTETSSSLSPPLAPPPPPPLMPKTKGKCKAKGRDESKSKEGSCASESCTPAGSGHTSQNDPASQLQQLLQTQDVQAESQSLHVQVQPQPSLPPSQIQGQVEPGQFKAVTEAEEVLAQVTTKATAEHLPEDTDYKQPSPRISISHSPSLSPYLSPSISPRASPLLFPKVSSHDSPSDPLSLSPYQSPSPSPKVPFSLSPFISPSTSPTVEEAYHTPSTFLRMGLRSKEEGRGGEGGGEEDGNETDDEEGEEETQEDEEDEMGLLLQQIYAASLSGTDSCSSLSSLEEAVETPPPTPLIQDHGGLSPGHQ